MSDGLAPFLAELTKREDLSRLYRPFRDRYLEVLVNCHELGADYYFLKGGGYRDPMGEQLALWAKGRKQIEDGSWIVIDEKLIVTKAPPWSSDHNYGIGADSSRDKDLERAGLQPGWAMPDYRILAEEAKRVGLNALYYSTSFPEGPHVGLPIKKYGITHRTLHVLHERGGMPAVWDFLDGYSW